jgi:hypothetical protein
MVEPLLASAWRFAMSSASLVNSSAAADTLIQAME